MTTHAIDPLLNLFSRDWSDLINQYLQLERCEKPILSHEVFVQYALDHFLGYFAFFLSKLPPTCGDPGGARIETGEEYIGEGETGEDCCSKVGTNLTGLPMF